ncbi:hypothetical protein BD410DRAFT_826585 [Rickenella mellea]|uniref:Uncharacterized protein n=1 Tax=Rickenella mellea TaxID=50990 RepID=A0A4Y7QD86_9AGAM|nr:hypothetical protein BD410DRAFT_826585 [Rickenella mellea]
MADENSNDCVDRMEVDVLHAQTLPDSKVPEPPCRAQAGLPFDVLSHIFLECLPDKGFPTLSTKVAPMTLGRVCSYWRDVALATHVLWAAFNVTSLYYYSSTGYLSNGRCALGLQEWIRRAGQCALSFHVSFYSTNDPGMDVVDTILLHRRRWKYAEGHLPADKWEYVVSAIAEGTPLLEHFDISTDHGYTSTIQLSSTPFLQTLMIKSTHKVLGLEACGRSLRRLSIRIANWNDGWSYLVSCPNLEIFEVESEHDSGSFRVDSDVEVLEARNLVSLRISLTTASPLLDRLHCPVLKTIYFDSCDTDSILVSFLARSSPPLESLTITAPFSSEILLDCLYHTPALKSLTVYRRPVLTHADVKALQLGPDAEKNICPGLQNINFETCVGYSNMKPMVEMVVSRWRNGGVFHCMNSEGTSAQGCQLERTLRSIRLGGCDFVEYSSYDSAYFASQPEIARCIEEGLEVSEEPPSDSDSD